MFNVSNHYVGWYKIELFCQYKCWQQIFCALFSLKNTRFGKQNYLAFETAENFKIAYFIIFNEQRFSFEFLKMNWIG